MHSSIKTEEAADCFNSVEAQEIKSVRSIKVENETTEVMNVGKLHLENEDSYKFFCEFCGEKFHFSLNYDKHKNQHSARHKYFKCCNKIENFENKHKCKNNPKDIDCHVISDKQEKGNISDSNDNGNSYDEVDSERDTFDENTEKKKRFKKKITQNEETKLKIFKCQECLQLFTKYIHLNHHLRQVHKKQGKFKCLTCDEDFNTNEDFKSHMVMHGPEDRVVCKGCKKSFSTLKLYYVHAKQNPGMHCFICKLCLREFPTELMLDQHVCICQNGKPLHCACGKEFTRYKDVIDHSKGTKPFYCCSCSHLANSLTAYIRHLRKHSKQKPYHCPKCDMKFAVIDFLNIHNKKFHNENENTFAREQILDSDQAEKHICNFCHENFKSAAELKQHSSRVHEETSVFENERVQCLDCGKLLKKNRLENHRNTHKTSASLCPECGKLFDTRFKLTQHIITAHNNEPVKCEVCKKILKTKKILNEHMKTHLKSELGGRIPQAICPMCGLGLAQKGSLARHILLTHEKHKIKPCNKTYTCHECSTILPNRAKYYSHRRMHRAMVDRFPCEICGREFNKKQNLKRHMYLLHDESRVLADPIFKCQFCTRCFREKKNLKRHYKMVHKVEDIV